MRVSSIDYNKLLKLVTKVRSFEKLSMSARRELASELLRQADVIHQTDIENLMCIPCAARLANYTLAGFRRKAERELHIYRLCHRERLNHFHGLRNKSAMIEYVDRREVLEVRKEETPKQLPHDPIQAALAHCNHVSDQADSQ